MLMFLLSFLSFTAKRRLDIGRYSSADFAYAVDLPSNEAAKKRRALSVKNPCAPASSVSAIKGFCARRRLFACRHDRRLPPAFPETGHADKRGVMKTSALPASFRHQSIKACKSMGARGQDIKYAAP
ncbi:hypothetical protein ACSHT0_14365 [Tepidicaulis sp. LMO-SS28]|uniref:hypothetical protein n=1 Tax=Tepidicaulis sp. LMO-SS28 TaxID=3447455 RepID=UPI003EDF68C5